MIQKNLTSKKSDRAASSYEQATAKSGLGNPFIKSVGIVAGDEESYEIFAELMDPIIEERQ